jgi:hypothetical protein
MPMDVQDILKIKASTRNDSDFLAWNPEKNGVFTVKSAYHLAFEEQLRQDGRHATSMNPLGQSAYWKLIWQWYQPKFAFSHGRWRAMQ